MKKLFIIHAGYYDPSISGGAYESHVNLLVAAENGPEARARAKNSEEFRARKMHVDSVQEILAVEGHEVLLRPRESLAGKTLVRIQKYGSRRASVKEI